MFKVTDNYEKDSAGGEEMKTFDYIHCRQHRELDIPVRCCFEPAFVFQTAPWGTVYPRSFVQKCLWENVLAKYWGQRKGQSLGQQVFSY